jgi:diaminopimelate epimerase
MIFEAIDGLRTAEIFADANGDYLNTGLDTGRPSFRSIELLSSCEGMIARINMGRPSFLASDIPADLEVDEVIDYPLAVNGAIYNITCVQVGTPHAVILAPLSAFWDEMPLVSPKIETHPAFPQRVSVTWCAPESDDSLRIRTWERGVGPTLGCGTGACAASVVANRHGLTGDHVKVTSPGGTLAIDWPDHQNLFMAGPAKVVFDGNWPLLGDEFATHELMGSQL